MTFTSRQSAADGHILISGTGRAGTTLLVQYFTALGFDTGFTLDQALQRIDPISKSGLERGFKRGDLFYVSKSPHYSTSLLEHLDRGDLAVKCCIVPVRELHAAAESRRHASQLAQASGRNPLRQPGGLAFRAERNPKRQEEKLARVFYQLIYALVEHDVPIYFLRFPAFARGEQDLFSALAPLLTEHGVSAEESRRALGLVLRPGLINDFGGDA
jgi:hypothetical protein